MRLGLLAPQESGKSSYLVALYATLVHGKQSSPNSSVKYSVSSPEQRLRLNTLFRDLINQNLPKKDRFPPKTKGTIVEYVFRATHKTSGDTHDVTIVDFPGELLRGADNDDSEAYNETKIALASCDSFIVLLDAEFLIAGDIWTVNAQISPSDISQILSEALASRSGEFSALGVPIVFCVSKLDLLGKLAADQAENIEIAYNKILALFPDFFEPEHEHPVMIAGISLGEKISGKPGEERDATKLGGPFEPFFIETPFEFCLSLGSFSASRFFAEQEKFWSERRDMNQMKAYAIRQKGFLEQIGEWFNNGAEFGETAGAYHERMGRMNASLMEENKAVANAYFNVGYEVTRQINTSNKNNSYVIYYAGMKHEFDISSARGDFPLKIVTW